jgi:hypothetical protein
LLTYAITLKITEIAHTKRKKQVACLKKGIHPYTKYKVVFFKFVHFVLFIVALLVVLVVVVPITFLL